MLWSWVYHLQYLVISWLGHQSHDTAFMKDLTHREGSHKIETTHVHEIVPCSTARQGDSVHATLCTGNQKFQPAMPQSYSCAGTRSDRRHPRSAIVLLFSAAIQLGSMVSGHYILLSTPWQYASAGYPPASEDRGLSCATKAVYQIPKQRSCNHWAG